MKTFRQYFIRRQFLEFFEAEYKRLIDDPDFCKMHWPEYDPKHVLLGDPDFLGIGDRMSKLSDAGLKCWQVKYMIKLLKMFPDMLPDEALEMALSSPRPKDI